MAAAGGTGSLAIALFGDRWFLLVGAGLMAVATGVAAVTTRGQTRGGPRRRAPRATNSRTNAAT